MLTQAELIKEEYSNRILSIGIMDQKVKRKPKKKEKTIFIQMVIVFLYIQI